MELQTAIEILEYHQEWRLGKREDMIHEPKKLTEALDIVLSEVKKLSKGAVIRTLPQMKVNKEKKCCSGRTDGYRCADCGNVV